MMGSKVRPYLDMTFMPKMGGPEREGETTNRPECVLPLKKNWSSNTPWHSITLPEVSEIFGLHATFCLILPAF